MSPINNHQSNDLPLYDRFIKDLSKEDGASSQCDVMEAFQSFCDHHIKHLPGSTDKSNRGKGEVPEGDSNTSLNFTEEDKQQFLEKIYQPVARDNVHGFDYDEQSLKMMLLNEKSRDSFQLIGVVGKLGVGKTALCRLILDEEEVKQRFVPRLLVPLPEPESKSESEEPKSMENVFKELSESEKRRSMENVVKRMLEHLGVEEDIINFISEGHELPGLLYALHLQLKGKKFLIVLDDVQEQAGYYDILTSCLSDGHGFPKASGGAVILTSRNKEAVKSIVREQNLHRLLPLSDLESCWQIYQTVALGDGIHFFPRPSTSIEVQKELREKCGGLPLVARIIGELKNRQKRPQVDSNQPSKTSGVDPEKEPSQAATASIEPGLQSKQEIINPNW